LDVLVQLRIANNAIRNIVEESCQLIEVLLRDRIIFMVMTPCTLNGKHKEHRGCGVDAIGDVFRVIFFFDDATFCRENVVAVEAGGDLLAE
jgi:hypothetical protein